MAKKKIKHKQSKYFTIMLIPDSAVKVQSIKIPHWVFHVLGGVLAAVLTIVVVSRTQASHFEKMFNNSTVQLEETLQEKEKIEGEKSKLQNSFEEEKEKLLNEKEDIEGKINGFENKVGELQEKIDEIDSIKEDIYDKISVLKDKGAPITVEFDDGTSPMGGPHIPLEEGSSFEQALEVLDNRLSNDIIELQLLNEAADDIQPFLRAYPTGWPVSGRITSGYGGRSNPFGGSSYEGHSGLDIKASTGTKVAVTGDGTVSYSSVQGGYGNLIIVNHGYGYSTYYAHNSKLVVNVGDKVKRGDVVALSGSTGRSTGPHCHYEVRINQVPQNPLDYVN